MEAEKYALVIILAMCVAVSGTAMSLKQQVKDTRSKGFLDLFKLTGDVVPSTYPVLKFNQNVSNDSTFAGLREREIRELQEDVLRWMPQQRHNLQNIMEKLERQKNQVDELARAMERQ